MEDTIKQHAALHATLHLQEHRYGERIRRLRKAAGWSQKEFAGLVKIGVSSLRRYEKEERRPPLDLLERMAAVLRISTAAFLWEKTEPPVKSVEEIKQVCLRLNEKGRQKALELLDLLEKIPEYQKEPG